MKKLLGILVLGLLFFSNANSEERELELNKLFNQLKNYSNASMAYEVEMKIWNIWSTHPTHDSLTQSLAKGSGLISKGELEEAYKIFYQLFLLVALFY